MSRMKIDQKFEVLKTHGDKAFSAYIMAGDGGLDQLKSQIGLLESAGVDMIEVGIPFSDPVADGPVIQEAGVRALDEGVSLKGVLDELKHIKDDVNIPLIIMTYVNPVLNLGYAQFASLAKEADISGVIIPDVPYEEEADIKHYLTPEDIAFIRLITLTSDARRIEQLSQGAEGFIYAVTVKGTTGGRKSFSDDTFTHLGRIKDIADVPVLAGFGVSSREMAEELGRYTDGVIVGSRIVDALHKGDTETIKNLVPEKRLHVQSDI